MTLPNLFLLDTNISHLVNGDSQPAFQRPGFEDKSFQLTSHYLTEILTDEQWQIIDAAPRIKQRENLMPASNLVDLEHARLTDLMLGAESGQAQVAQPVHRWWTTRAHLSGQLQRLQPFRYDPQGRLCYALLPIDESEISFFQLHDDGEARDLGLSPKGLANEIELPMSSRISVWAVPNYLDELQTLAEDKKKELLDCAKKYGTIDLPGRKPEQIWCYHWALGFRRR